MHDDRRVQRTGRAPFATRDVLVVVTLLAVVLLLLADRYGPHRDELYFVAAGRHLAWGYPDQPALTPLLARLMTALSPHDLVVLRLPSVVAVCALVVLTASFARLLGGGRAAQLLAAATVAASAFTVTIGHRLSTATFDTLAWTAVLVVVGHALVDERPRLWLVAGLLAGVGLNNKHAVAFLLLGVLVAVAVSRETRWQLRTAYPWLGGLLAMLMWLPNLLWQAHHGWPVLTLSADIADEYGGLGGRIGLVAQALVMFSPVIAVLWIYGLVQLLRRPEWARARPVGVTFVVVAAVFLVTGGKGYYLAGLVPPLVAAGSTALALRWPARRLLVAGVVLALSAIVAWPALVPVLPVRTYTASFYPAIDADQPETIGWPELVATVRGTVRSLPPAQRRTAVLFTGNYGEAGALQWYDAGRPVFSGHNGWADWGPPPGRTGPVVVVGWQRPQDEFTGCRRGPVVVNHEGADNEERGNRVWVCAGPRGSWARQWPRLSHLDA
jgi:4-amino-4-deoxy-L-arabinose transferase-like glycosyltransferase